MLSGKIALVTGGSRGIGSGICQELSRLGATVVVNYSSNKIAADEVVKGILNSGGKAKAFGFDVGNGGEVENGIRQIIDEYQGIDILVNNAGIAKDGLLLRTKDEDWQKTIDVNLSSCFYCARAVAKSMVRARAGRIINISSVIGEMGNAGQVAYAASKAGIFGLTKSLAKELGSRGITVNAITPGYIKTDMTGQMNEEMTERILAQVPLQRLGEINDVTKLVAFLASDNAGYITGQVIGVNGGLYM